MQRSHPPGDNKGVRAVKRNADAVNTCEKERIRAEIDAQVQEFLARGGRIETVVGNARGDNNLIGGVWHNPMEVPINASS